VYAETIAPNCAAEMPSRCMSSGPSGIMIMKSRMRVSCTAAISQRTWRSCRRASDGGTEFSRVSEEVEDKRALLVMIMKIVIIN
jgi:hypothetical protein